MLLHGNENLNLDTVLEYMSVQCSSLMSCLKNHSQL